MASPLSIVWLRDDLRIADNPALDAASRAGPVVALYVLDEVSPGVRPLGGAAKWWLHRSLEALSRDLAARGIPLILRRGPQVDTVHDLGVILGANLGATWVSLFFYWNRRYDPAGIRIDRELKARLKQHNIPAVSHHANVLFEPFNIATGDGRPYRVFTPFWKSCLAAEPPRTPLPEPETIEGARLEIASDDLADWNLLPTAPNWAGEFGTTWTPGEAGARAALDRFVEHNLEAYADSRDRPDLDITSRLSPHLRFGEVSPFTVWHAANTRGHAASAGRSKFLAEIGWREFSWHLTYHFGDLSQRNFNAKFDGLRWERDAALIRAWQRGRTGIPLVDAGMRQLWRTGWMHNRVRMVAASFLAKHLLQDWRAGEAWFWDTLVDADIANNPAGWQWVAGTGADAAPYFRIFNPVTQGEKFDPDGTYIRQWVPELAHLPAGRIHRPHDAGLFADGPATGYPRPVVDLSVGRDRALATLAALRDGSEA